MPVLLFALGIAITPARAQQEEFTTIDYPGAAATYAFKINDSGDIVGYFTDSANVNHGFLLSAGKFTEIGYPGARHTYAYGINNRGDIVGNYVDGAGAPAGGYLLRQGEFTPLECPGANLVVAWDINSGGDIAGHVIVSGKPDQGVVWSGGVCTLSDYQPQNSRRTMTMFFGINNAGVAVGHWVTNGGDSHGIVLNKGAMTRNHHGGGGALLNWGINNGGDIVGQLTNAYNQTRAFLLRDRRYTVFNYPGATGTRAYGINSSGQIVGAYGVSGVQHGFLARVPASGPPAELTVDDDGGDCAGAIPTIQEAVRRAGPGTTIRVCPGTYFGSVLIEGEGKSGLKLIAMGAQDEIVLQGDYGELNGFHLRDVQGVLIRGFTVRDFGTTATTAAVFGSGNLIHLENADYNGIEYNRLINGDMMGIMLTNSKGNVIEHNTAFVTNAALANCGIHVQGKRSSNNHIRNNMTYGNKVAGIMVRGAGPENWVLNNTSVDNGRFGIDVQNTESIWIEGNRVSNGRGPWGTAPFAREEMNMGIGINLVNVDKATVKDNRARGNTGMDLNWDGKGQNTFAANACEKSAPSEMCAR